MASLQKLEGGFFYTLPHQNTKTLIPPSMTLQQAQHTVDEWIRTIGQRYFNEMTNTAILAEEVGEVARLMARLYGEQSFKTPEEAAKLVQMARSINPSVLLEASGNMDLDRVRSYADAGVDLISVGKLTHSARAVDISFKIQIA